jgi:hypothetical protein
MKQFMSDSDSLNGILYWLQFIHCLRGRFSLQMLHIPALGLDREVDIVEGEWSDTFF